MCIVGNGSIARKAVSDMFDFAETTKDMTASEILNYYRNLYYAEPQVTERGIMANAINDYFADVVPKSKYADMEIRALRAEKQLATQQDLAEKKMMDGVNKIVTPEEVTDDKEVKVLKHKVVRVDNLMYNGCEPHWKCTRCGKCVPFHCYTKKEFESQDCRPSSTDNPNRK